MFKIPGGREKGMLINEAEDSSIIWWRDHMRKQIAAGTAKNPTRDQEWINAAEVELASRSGNQNTNTQRTSTQQPVSRTAIAQYQGAHNDAAKATEVLAKIQEVGHLVSPAPAVATLPIGTAIVISAVLIDAEKETYSVQAGLGLSKVALDRIGAAAGISWSSESGRLDDGSDPRYVHFRAVGFVKEFDGTPRRIIGEKVLDLRDGSPTVEALQNRAESKANREGGRVGNWQNQVRDARMFILEQAESKARLRAIRSLGIKTSYSAAELKKPFFIAKVQFTGECNDPEIKRMFAQHIAAAFSGSTAMLYGQQRAEPPQLRNNGYVPPPVNAIESDDPYMDVEGTLEHEDGVPVDNEDRF